MAKKFQIGDQVKVLKAAGMPQYQGKVGEVINDQPLHEGDYPYTVRFGRPGAGGWFYRASELELA